ncbi:MAG TPA: hypothetical protein PKE64_31670 [Anaerolineae bacterium]|nr:hypothetical protein [Anaerolineae bacterium]
MPKLSTTAQPQWLFESGLVYLDRSPVEIKRGMAILGQDGRKAGQVAAVVLRNGCPPVTHLLVNSQSQPPAYRLVPIDLIKQVSEETVWLHLSRKDVAHLPPWVEESNEIG